MKGFSEARPGLFIFEGGFPVSHTYNKKPLCGPSAEKSKCGTDEKKKKTSKGYSYTNLATADLQRGGGPARARTRM